MAPQSFDVVLITGAPGSGKSSVASALAKTIDRAVVISGDDVRALVKSEFKSPAEAWTDEHRLQYYLSFENEASLARNFIAKNFKVIVEDVVHNHHDLFAVWKNYFAGVSYATALLAPTKEKILERNRSRSKNLPESIIDSLYPLMLPENFPDWIVLDTTNQTVYETTDTIKRNIGW